MKKFLCTLFATALLTGCGDNTRTEISGLNVRLSMLQNENEHLAAELAELRDTVNKMNTLFAQGFGTVVTNTDRLLTQVEHADGNYTDLSARVYALEHRTNYVVFPAARPAYRARTNTITPTPRAAEYYGVPENVYQIMYAAAIKQWPENFQMQDYEMRTQSEAWKKLHP